MTISIGLIAQLIGWIGTIINTLSFQVKNTIHMVLLQALAGIVFGTHYLLLFHYRYLRQLVQERKDDPSLAPDHSEPPLDLL